MESILRMNGITKAFAGVPALEGVDFKLRGGEIHALLGANGAGKSTLMKILSGVYEADRGSIEIDGRPIRLHSPADAKEAGIHCVYQEVDTSLIPHLTVSENLFLDRLAGSKRKAWIRWTAIHEEAESLLQRIGAGFSPRKLVRDLTLPQKQLVLIARILAAEAKFVILDEPTAPLSLEEAEKLFFIMRELKKAGLGIVFISHRLPEVFEICDTITVMRDGANVLSLPRQETDIKEVVGSMLGRSLGEEYPKAEVTIGEAVLSVQGLTSGAQVREIDLDVRSGEIVAVVGLVGAGKTELARVLFGADPADRGTVSVKGRKADLRSPADAIRSGIALVPEERRKEGILVRESVLHNLSLPSLKSFSRFGFMLGRSETRGADRAVNLLGIKTPSVSQLTAYLSGGNQQKVAIGKWLGTNADVFLFDEPTKGVDVGAKGDIFRIIGSLAEQGKAVLYLTCEIEEALGVADRILVMEGGAIVKSFARGEATPEKLLYFASAGKGELV
jgi:simple sugar transport system ATP-binding protein